MKRIIHELLGQLALRKKVFRENPVTLEQMGGLIDMVQSGLMTGTDGDLRFHIRLQVLTVPQDPQENYCCAT